VETYLHGYQIFHEHHIFLGDANIMFCLKNTTMQVIVPQNIITSQVVEPTTFVLYCRRCYYSPMHKLHFGSFWKLWRTCVINRDDSLSIKFCENDSFRKLLLFFENNFRYLHEISQHISVSHFDSRRSLTSANRRRSTSPTFLSALLSLVISKTGRSERSARALHDGADVVREAIGN